jgi:hypothetical protein
MVYAMRVAMLLVFLALGVCAVDGQVAHVLVAGVPLTQGTANGPAVTATFTRPQSMARHHGTGVLYFTEVDSRNHIRALSADGIVTRLCGDTVAGFVDGAATAARFNSPMGLAVDQTTGTIFVADYANSAVRSVTPAGAVSTLVGHGYVAYAVVAAGTGTAASLPTPRALSLRQSTGTLFVTVTDHMVVQIVVSTRVMTILAGAGTTGYLDAIGSLAKIASPRYLTVADSAGIVYVADVNSRIRAIDLQTRAVSTVSGGAGYVSAQDALIDGPAAAATFGNIQGMAFHASTGVVLIDDGVKNIRMFDPAARTVSTLLTSTFRTVAGVVWSGGAMVVDDANSRFFLFDAGLSAVYSLKFTPTFVSGEPVGPFTVKVLDNAGNVCTSLASSIMVTAQVTLGPATPATGSPVALSSGIAVFTALTFDLAGSGQQLAFATSVPTASGNGTVVLTSSALHFNLKHGQPSQLTVTQ